MLNTLITQKAPPTFLEWYGCHGPVRTAAPWPNAANDMIRGRYIRGETFSQVVESGEFKRLVPVYALIYHAEEWEKAHGPISLTTLTTKLLDGKYDSQFKKAYQNNPLASKPCEWGALWEWRP